MEFKDLGKAQGLGFFGLWAELECFRGIMVFGVSGLGFGDVIRIIFLTVDVFFFSCKGLGLLESFVRGSTAVYTGIGFFVWR